MTNKKEPLKMNVDLRIYPSEGTLEWWKDKAEFYGDKVRQLYESLIDERTRGLRYQIKFLEEKDKTTQLIFFARSCIENASKCCHCDEYAITLLTSLDIPLEDNYELPPANKEI